MFFFKTSLSAVLFLYPFQVSSYPQFQSSCYSALKVKPYYLSGGYLLLEKNLLY